MQISINGIKISTKFVHSPEEVSNGMMEKKFKNKNDGMLFGINKGHHSFWMKDCIQHLDIIFIKNGVITKIHHNCPPCKTNDCDHYQGNGNFVLELNGGFCKKHGIKEGDELTM
jgi:uncharacterized membrane protein (UPF0127 family)